jgi:hypothetical protein
MGHDAGQARRNVKLRHDARPKASDRRQGEMFTGDRPAQDNRLLKAIQFSRPSSRKNQRGGPEQDIRFHWLFIVWPLPNAGSDNKTKDGDTTWDSSYSSF